MVVSRTTIALALLAMDGRAKISGGSDRAIYMTVKAGFQAGAVKEPYPGQR
jgi:hypothetical protein